MAWPCFMVKTELCPVEPLEGGGTIQSTYFVMPDGRKVSFKELPPGAMWWDDDELVVKLPGGKNGNDWNIDRGRKLNEQAGQHRYPAWARTGEPPNITATPSINWQGNYHGWLQNGILTDDCEGRKL